RPAVDPPADLPGVRACRLLRPVDRPTCDQALPGDQAPGHGGLLRAGRLGLVLRRQGDDRPRRRRHRAPARLEVVSTPLATLVFYGSYRRDRVGIRMARYVTEGLAGRGHAAELIDAREVGLPMLDRMYKEHSPGQAPANMEALAAKLRAADAFVFIAGEYN